MAKAPRPGAARKSSETRATITITLRDGAPVTIAPTNVSMAERLVCRKATGLPFEAFLGDEDKFGEDSVMVLWWLARRASGEPMLTFRQAADEWPADLKPEELELELDDGTGDGQGEDDAAELAAKGAHPEG